MRRVTLWGCAVALALLQFGCQSESTESGTNDSAAVNAANADGLLAEGTEAIGGIGDFAVKNNKLRFAVDAAGNDSGTFLGSFFKKNIIAASGGSLIDLELNGKANDTLTQNFQGVLGLNQIAQLGFVASSSGGTDPGTGAPLTLLTLASGKVTATVTVDAAAGFTPGNTLTGVDSGATATIVAVNGTEVEVGFITGSLSVNEPVSDGVVNAFVTDLVIPMQDGDIVTIIAAGDTGDLGVQGQVVAVGAGGSTATFVIATGQAFNDDTTLTAGLQVRPNSPLDNQLIYTQIISRADIDELGKGFSGVECRGFIIDVVANTPVGTVASAAVPGIEGLPVLTTTNGFPLTVTTFYGVRADDQFVTMLTTISHDDPAGSASIFSTADVHINGVSGGIEQTRPFNPITGFAAQGASETLVVPFASLVGRDASAPASYTYVDPVIGQMILVSDQLFQFVAELNDPATTITQGTPAVWRRALAIGDQNDVASSADVAMELLSAGALLARGVAPNAVGGNVAAITGNVPDAPAGTIVNIFQVAPALVFDGAGFIDSPVPTAFGASGSMLLYSAVAVDENGDFSVLVPGDVDLALAISPFAASAQAGSATAYALTVTAPEHVAAPPASVPVAAGSTGNNFTLSGAGTVNLTVNDVDTGQPIPARVVFHGRTVNLGEAQSASGVGNSVYLPTGTGSVEVSAGSINILASRGLEYSVASTTITVVDGGSSTVTLDLRRVLDFDAGTAGGPGFDSPLRRFVSADFHIHSGFSFDSAVPLRDRVASYASVGVELMVSTDHDNIADYSSSIVDLGLETAVTSVSGDEVTPFLPWFFPGTATPIVIPPRSYGNSVGHFGAWPIAQQPNEPRNGAPADEFRPGPLLFQQLRALDPAATMVVQLNHPRDAPFNPPLPPLGLGYFSNERLTDVAAQQQFAQKGTGLPAITRGGYEATLTASAVEHLDTQDPFNTAGLAPSDFDAVEIFGGSIFTYEHNRRDWYALLSAGIVRTATANSDSHNLNGSSGFPRTFVRAGGTDDASLDLSTLDKVAINSVLQPGFERSGRFSAGTGTVTSTPAAARLGDQMEVLGSSGAVVFIEVDADEDGNFEAQAGDFQIDDGDDSVDVRVTVIAPAWVPIDTVELIVNGGSLGVQGSTSTLDANRTGFDGQLISITPTSTPANPLDSGFNVVRVREVRTVALASGHDNWISAVAFGDASSSTIYNLLVEPSGLDGDKGQAPAAVGFTNPIFIDNPGAGTPGVYDPPGVPSVP